MKVFLLHIGSRDIEFPKEIMLHYMTTKLQKDQIYNQKYSKSTLRVDLYWFFN